MIITNAEDAIYLLNKLVKFSFNDGEEFKRGYVTLAGGIESGKQEKFDYRKKRSDNDSWCSSFYIRIAASKIGIVNAFAIFDKKGVKHDGIGSQRVKTFKRCSTLHESRGSAFRNSFCTVG